MLQTYNIPELSVRQKSHTARLKALIIDDEIAFKEDWV